MDDFKKKCHDLRLLSITGVVLIILFALVGAIVAPLISSAIQGYIFMLCHNNGIVKVVSEYVNPITFLQAFLIIFSVQAIRTQYLGSIKYFSKYIEDDLNTDKKWLPAIISATLVIIFFIIDIVVFQYTYDTILPQVLKFKLPELDDIQLFALFYGLNLLFRHPTPTYVKKGEEG